MFPHIPSKDLGPIYELLWSVVGEAEVQRPETIMERTDLEQQVWGIWRLIPGSWRCCEIRVAVVPWLSMSLCSSCSCWPSSTSWMVRAIRTQSGSCSDGPVWSVPSVMVFLEPKNRARNGEDLTGLFYKSNRIWNEPDDQDAAYNRAADRQVADRQKMIGTEAGWQAGRNWRKRTGLRPLAKVQVSQPKC